MPTAMDELLMSGNAASTGEGRSGAAAVEDISDGTVTGVPGARDSVGDRETGALLEIEPVADTGGKDTGPPGVSANTAASRSFNLLKRGGLSCLGGRAGLDLRGLSLLL